MHVEEKDYTVDKIEGDYATLTEDGAGESLFIALALLPPGTDVGSKLHYADFSFTLLL